MIDRVNDRIGNYQLIQLLGQGSFADVYLGQHLYLDRQAAIKMQHPLSLSQDHQAFLTEARTISKLDHPHIIHLLDFGVEEYQDIPFLVMEYAPYGTLRQHHPQGACLSLHEVVGCIKQIAAALQYAHNMGVIHRDVKPENVLIGQQGKMQLSDFGIAVILRDSFAQREQEIGGTIAYMAPEQLQGKPVAASDQYALAVVAYELLVGAPPFTGTIAEIGSQHLFAPVPSLYEKNGQLSKGVNDVIQTALAKDPMQRFSSVESFALALEQSASASLDRCYENQSQRVVVQKPPSPFSTLFFPAPLSMRHLTNWIELHVPRNFSSTHKRYCQYLCYQHRDLDVKGLGTQNVYTLALDQVFVELRIVPTPLHALSTDPLQINNELQHGKLSIWDFLAAPALNQHHFVLIGAPGSGKTTLLKHIVLALAGERKGNQHVTLSSTLPLLLFLRDHVERIKMQPAQYSLEDAADDHHRKYWKQHMPEGWLHQRLLNGQCLILLDGLDEVADPDARKLVVDWVQQQMFVHGQNRFIITSRPFGYKSNPLDSVTVLEVNAFTQEQIEHFVHYWYQANEIMSAQRDDPGVRMKARSGADDLLGRLYDAPTLFALAVNPLLLTMVATVHRYRDTLPGKRVMLYNEICEVFLGKRQEAKGVKLEFTVAQKRQVLQPLAFAMMCKGMRDISLQEASQIIEAPLAQISLRMQPVAFLRLIEESSGLLLEREQDIYSFAHLTFQEYLASAYVKDEGLDHVLIEQRHSSWWHETIRLYCAQADATSLIIACLSEQPISIGVLTLAIECQQEALKVQPSVRAQLDVLLDRGIEDGDPEQSRLIGNVLLTRRLLQMVHFHGETYIDTSFVMCGEYQLFLDDQSALGHHFHPDHWQSRRFPPGQGHCPLLGLRSSDALAFCRWLNEHEYGPWSYRLPTPYESQTLMANGMLPSQLPAHTGYWTIDEQNLAQSTLDTFTTEEKRLSIEDIFEQDCARVRTLHQDLVQCFHVALDCSRTLAVDYHLDAAQHILDKLLYVRDHDFSLKLMSDATHTFCLLRADTEQFTTSLLRVLTRASSLARVRGNIRAHERVRVAQCTLELAQTLNHAILTAYVLASASSLNLEQIRPLDQDDFLSLACSRTTVYNLDLGSAFASTLIFTNQHAADFVRKNAHERNRVHALVNELQLALEYVLDRAHLFPETGEDAMLQRNDKDLLRWYIRIRIQALTIFIYNWWSRSSPLSTSLEKEHAFMVTEKSGEQDSFVETALQNYLDLYVTFVLLEKRIQGKAEATEGLLLVKERYKVM